MTSLVQSFVNLKIMETTQTILNFKDYNPFVYWLLVILAAILIAGFMYLVWCMAIAVLYEEKEGKESE
jgi:hypothetical protein